MPNEPSEPTRAPGIKPTPTIPNGIKVASEWSWRLLLIALAISVTALGISHLSEIVIPVIVALLLAALLQPIFQRMLRVMPRGLASAVTVIGTLAVIVGLLTFVGNQFSGQFGDIVNDVAAGIDKIRLWIRDNLHVTDTQFSDYYDRAREALSNANLGESAAKAGLTATHAVAGFFITMFTLFFFLFDGPRIWAWIVRLFPRSARAKVASSGVIAWLQLQAFTKATILVAAVDATGIGLGALILGVPFASGVALLVFFGAFIPVVGAAMSGAVAVLLALVAKGPITALIMLGVVIAVQQLESHLLQPVLLGRAVRIHPLAIILAIASGVVLWGIVGALIAVPVAAVVNAVGNHLLVDPESDPEPDPGLEEADSPVASAAPAPTDS